MVLPAVESHIMARVFGLLGSVDPRLPKHSLVQPSKHFWDVFSGPHFVGDEHPGSGRVHLYFEI